MVLVLGVVGILGFSVWLRGYLRGPEFLALVNARASEILRAEMRFSEFRWEGMHVQSPAFEVIGEEMVRRIEGEEFETSLRVGALVRKKFRSSDFIGRSLHVELDATRDAPVFPEPTSAFEFPGLKVEALSGEVDFGSSVWAWSGVMTDVQPGSATDSYDVRLSRGMVETPVSLFPSGSLRSVRARYHDGSFYVTDAEFGIYENGRLRLVGEGDFRKREYSFEGEMRRVYCEEMVPEDWKKRLLGTLESDFTVQGAGKNPALTSGSLVLRDGVLTALPVLDRLAAYTDTSRFRRLTLDTAELDYRQHGKRLELTNIVLASEGLTRLEGRLEIVGGRLDGWFQFGIAPGLLAHIPGAETEVFLPGKEGLLWTPLRVTGTLGDPEEDLSKRMIAAAGARMFELAPETGLWVLKNSGRVAGEMAHGVLDLLGDPAVDTGSSVVGQGVDVVREGVNGLFNLIPGMDRKEVPVPEELPEPDGETEPEEEKDPK